MSERSATAASAAGYAALDSLASPPSSTFSRNDWFILGGLALFTFIIHLVLYKGYGFFRDELYFIACSKHLDWGYVDQPPGVAIVAWLARHLLGDSLFAYRFFPALFGGLQVLLTGLTARAMGGQRFAQVFASICVLAAPSYFGSYLNTDMFMILGWAACAWIATRIFAGESPRYWLLFGMFAGLTLQGKHAMLFFGFAFVVGLLLSPQRKMLLGAWLWAGGLLALLIALPNIIWEYQHHWATYELLSNIAHSDKNLVLGPLEYVKHNILSLAPSTFPVWLGGLIWLLFSKAGKRFRALGWTWLAAYAFFIVMKGKDYYLIPVYAMLFAAGAVALEAWFLSAPARSRRVWLEPVLGTLVLVGGMLIWPFAMPMMSEERFIAYEKFLGAAPGKTENTELNDLTQQYADMHGWAELVASVAKVYNSIPEPERSQCAIFAGNYGEAGAVDYFGPQYGLPPAISAHQNYWFWGPRSYTGECLVIIAGSSTRERLEKNYTSVVQAGETDAKYAIPFENHRSIWIYRGRKSGSLQEDWPKLKLWI